MANDRSARVDVTRARGTTRRGYGNHGARADVFGRRWEGRGGGRGRRRGARTAWEREPFPVVDL